MDYVRADSTNLPKVDNMMTVYYIGTSDKHNAAEIRGAKMLMSSRDSYVDTAVGHVEVKRSGTTCSVRAKVVPEHKVSQKQYIVIAVINENANEIVDVTCDGCPASLGGCKHTLVLLFWLEKRSSEPASTSVTCYWKKPKLSNLRTEHVEAENIFPQQKKIKLSPPNENVLNDFLNICKNNNLHCLTSSFVMPKNNYNVFDMTVHYLTEYSDNPDFDHYMNELDKKITSEVKEMINEKTQVQADSVMWHYVRQGRITASKIYDAAHCSTDGSLVQQILGGYKVPETLAIIRGKKLEAQVIERAEEILKIKINKVGFMLINCLIGASPDGVTSDFTVEVKCPFSTKTLKSYVDSTNNKIKDKCAAQMFTQMCAMKKNKGLLIVADPGFEVNKTVNFYWLDYDNVIMTNLITKSLAFWKQFVFKKVIDSARS